MDMREMTCIACPMGCRLRVGRNAGGQVVVENAACKRGARYGEQEFTCPMRTVTSSVRVLGGQRPVCAVKTRDVVPKEKIGEVLRAIAGTTPQAPLRVGQVLLQNVADTGVDLVAAANCKGCGDL